MTDQLPQVDDQLPELVETELPANDQLPEVEGLSLADVAEGSAPVTSTELVKPAAAMTPDQVLGLVAKLSGMTLPPEVRKQYEQALKGDELVQLGLMASGFCEALAEYGIGTGGGNLPPWMSLVFGAGVLAYGVTTHRGTYAGQQKQVADTGNGAGGGPGGFDFGGITGSDLSSAISVATSE